MSPQKFILSFSHKILDICGAAAAFSAGIILFVWVILILSIWLVGSLLRRALVS